MGDYFAKAFDFVRHDELLYKLQSLVGDFLRDRSFKVRVDDKMSEQRPGLPGIPQGSLLGPILYINTSAIYLVRLKGGCYWPMRMMFYLPFLGLWLVLSVEMLIPNLEGLHRYFTDWKLVLNLRKCVAVVFGGRPRTIYPNFKGYMPELMLGGELTRVSENM